MNVALALITLLAVCGALVLLPVVGVLLFCERVFHVDVEELLCDVGLVFGFVLGVFWTGWHLPFN